MIYLIPRNLSLIELFKKGKKIFIKKQNRGKFTEYCNGKVTLILEKELYLLRIVENGIKIIKLCFQIYLQIPPQKTTYKKKLS